MPHQFATPTPHSSNLPKIKPPRLNPTVPNTSHCLTGDHLFDRPQRNHLERFHGLPASTAFTTATLSI